jgi:hypothetical protein
MNFWYFWRIRLLNSAGLVDGKPVGPPVRAAPGTGDEPNIIRHISSLDTK